MGITVATRPYDEVTVFRVGHAYQKLTSHHSNMPTLVRKTPTQLHEVVRRRPAGLLEKPLITTFRGSFL